MHFWTRLVLFIFLNIFISALQNEDLSFNVYTKIKSRHDKHYGNELKTPSEISASASKYTKLYVSTRDDDGNYNYTELIFGNLTSITSSGIDAKKPIKILIHGWRGSAFSTFETTLTKTYLLAQNINLIALDWSKKARQIYQIAKDSVVPVGTYVAEFLDWLVEETGIPMSDIHIIGHSLGAHIGGVIGEHVSSGKIGRISGLDPAGPEFSNSSTSGRLDSSDAQFVDVIHTCGKWAGFYDACGHVDFYPNKGEPPQPGCKDLIVCSHLRSYQYFNESITSDLFVSTPCSSWKDFAAGTCIYNKTISMGEHVDQISRGSFYLYTKGSYPYALGNNVKVERRRKLK